MRFVTAFPGCHVDEKSGTFESPSGCAAGASSKHFPAHDDVRNVRVNPYARAIVSKTPSPTTQPTRHPAGMAPSRWRPPGEAVAFHAAAYAASTSVESYPPPSTPRRKSQSHNAVCERRDSMMMITVSRTALLVC